MEEELKVIEEAREATPMITSDTYIALRALLDAQLISMYEFQYYVEELNRAESMLRDYHERLFDLERIVKKRARR